jgi:branched-subunit amino acid transport protein
MELALLILGMALVTFATRYSMIVILGRWDVPRIVLRALTYVPMAAFAALIAPELLHLEQGALVFPADRFVAGVIAIIVAGLTRNSMLTIVFGMGSLWIVQALIVR